MLGPPVSVFELVLRYKVTKKHPLMGCRLFSGLVSEGGYPYPVPDVRSIGRLRGKLDSGELGCAARRLRAVTVWVL